MALTFVSLPYEYWHIGNNKNISAVNGISDNLIRSDLMNLDERVINYDNYDDFKIKVINNELKKIMKKLDKRKGKIHKECIGELDRDQSYEDLLYQYNRLLAEKIVELFKESRLKYILTEDDYKNLLLHEREKNILEGLSVINERCQEV